MDVIHLRKIVSGLEEIHHEGGPPVATPEHGRPALFPYRYGQETQLLQAMADLFGILPG